MFRKLTLIFLLYSYHGMAQDDLYLPKSYGSALNQIIRKDHYILSYNEEAEQAEWVAYELSPEELIKKFDRKDQFIIDPTVSSSSATLLDYKGSGYDRGHLAPAGDFTFSEKALADSFYMSNMSPQVPSFNRGLWSQLEEQFRTWARAKNGIYIITAGLLKDPKGVIGANKVVIPRYYYKIAYSPKNHSMVAFMMPNEDLKGRALKEFMVSVDVLEELTKIDFFPQLSLEEQKALESKIDFALWPLDYGNSGKSINNKDLDLDGDRELKKPALININTASLKELMNVDGLGKVLSERIIENRPFRSLNDLLKIKGISTTTFNKLKLLLTIE